MNHTGQPLVVELGARSYPIHVGQGLIGRAGEILAPVLRAPRAIVIADEALRRTGALATLETSLAGAGIERESFVLPAGERSKSFATLEELAERILERRIERKVTVIALGGGVIGDLAGFLAAILLRGLDFVQIPTTLLAQVDSSVGGKTGINSRHGKNLIGAFHQPRAVLIDTDVLKTLPQRELRAGYAETVKYGCLADRAFFDWLDEAAPALFEGDDEVRARAIRRSVEIKAAIVGADERETGDQRALLNFGHTFAHAYEAMAGYGGTVLHGEAVSVGMVKAARLSAELGIAPMADHARLLAHLRRLGMPVAARDLRNEGFAPDAMLRAMGRDKKVEAGRLRFVLWRGIGETFVSADVPEEAVARVLAEDG